MLLRRDRSDSIVLPCLALTAIALLSACSSAPNVKDDTVGKTIENLDFEDALTLSLSEKGWKRFQESMTQAKAYCAKSKERLVVREDHVARDGALVPVIYVKCL